MNLKFMLAGLCAWAAITGTANAQTTRVAYVDIDRVTEKSDKINSAMGNVKNRVEDIQKEIETKRKKATDLELEIKKGTGVIAETELSKKREESAKLKKELDDLQYEGRREMQKLDSTLFEPMVKTIVLAIQDVAKEKNIDLVVRGEAVIYGADSADITDEVVKKLNSSAYSDPASSKKATSDKEPDSTSKDSATSDKQSSDSDVKENAEPVKESAPATAEPTKVEPTKAAEKSESKSIIPSVPLVKRPVDRQSE